MHCDKSIVLGRETMSYNRTSLSKEQPSKHSIAKVRAERLVFQITALICQKVLSFSYHTELSMYL